MYAVGRGGPMASPQSLHLSRLQAASSPVSPVPLVMPLSSGTKPERPPQQQGEKQAPPKVVLGPFPKAPPLPPPPICPPPPSTPADPDAKSPTPAADGAAPATSPAPATVPAPTPATNAGVPQAFGSPSTFSPPYFPTSPPSTSLPGPGRPAPMGQLPPSAPPGDQAPQGEGVVARGIVTVDERTVPIFMDGNPTIPPPIPTNRGFATPPRVASTAGYLPPSSWNSGPPGTKVVLSPPSLRGPAPPMSIDSLHPQGPFVASPPPPLPPPPPGVAMAEMEGEVRSRMVVSSHAAMGFIPTMIEPPPPPPPSEKWRQIREMDKASLDREVGMKDVLRRREQMRMERELRQAEEKGKAAEAAFKEAEKARRSTRIEREREVKRSLHDTQVSLGRITTTEASGLVPRTLSPSSHSMMKTSLFSPGPKSTTLDGKWGSLDAPPADSEAAELVKSLNDVWTPVTNFRALSDVPRPFRLQNSEPLAPPPPGLPLEMIPPPPGSPPMMPSPRALSPVMGGLLGSAAHQVQMEKLGELQTMIASTQPNLLESVEALPPLIPGRPPIVSNLPPGSPFAAGNANSAAQAANLAASLNAAAANPNLPMPLPGSPLPISPPLSPTLLPSPPGPIPPPGATSRLIPPPTEEMLRAAAGMGKPGPAGPYSGVLENGLLLPASPTANNNDSKPLEGEGTSPPAKDNLEIVQNVKAALNMNNSPGYHASPIQHPPPPSSQWRPAGLPPAPSGRPQGVPDLGVQPPKPTMYGAANLPPPPAPARSPTPVAASDGSPSPAPSNPQQPGSPTRSYEEGGMTVGGPASIPPPPSGGAGSTAGASGSGSPVGGYVSPSAGSLDGVLPASSQGGESSPTSASPTTASGGRPSPNAPTRASPARSSGAGAEGGNSPAGSLASPRPPSAHSPLGAGSNSPTSSPSASRSALTDPRIPARSGEVPGAGSSSSMIYSISSFSSTEEAPPGPPAPPVGSSLTMEDQKGGSSP